MQNTWPTKKKILNSISNPQCRSRVVMQRYQSFSPVVVSRCNANQSSCKIHYSYPLFNLSRRISHIIANTFSNTQGILLARSFHEPKQARFSVNIPRSIILEPPLAIYKGYGYFILDPLNLHNRRPTVQRVSFAVVILIGGKRCVTIVSK